MSSSFPAAREFLLMSEFNYDFVEPLPLLLGNGVELADPSAAYWAIDRDDDRFDNGFAYEEGSRTTVLLTPERFVGAGEVHACLAKDHPPLQTLNSVRDDLFTALLALRLVKPVSFDLRAVLTIDQGIVAQAGRYLDQSGFNPVTAQQFGSAEIEKARMLNRRLVNLRRGRGCARIRSALANFGQVTLGLVGSWQLAMLGLFAALDAVFPQPGPNSRKQAKAAGSLKPNSTFDGLNYGPRLAGRVSKFLAGPLLRSGDQDWLADLYSQRRNGLAHGADFVVHRPPVPADASQSLPPAPDAEFGHLHELARLCLLGMLGYKNADLAVLLPEDSDQLAIQTALSSIAACPPRYLRRQTRWD